VHQIAGFDVEKARHEFSIPPDHEPVADKFVFYSRDREWTLPSVCFLYVHSSRGHRSIGSAMNSAMKIGQSIL
jgi:hypothetical protein